ncbi:NAD-dependent aldehyde dehydrogenase [Exophiala aquamarina CBS 119918]|uniref:aldehyde dehydrogenase (NAD(+)) n=1 Tax=Exophiala aquamarina CBS 119918 TaxID=1182545 RepID=A0A072PE74_9EURO|nr:NAD-dependent aldehyde dehydrogenase [Exophiala aquamarina CBS 119918]KEF57598.1 NAD-dependent aldehyde dehydrogenase [Exophiala aquamarina CBS 119918]
MSDIPHYSNWVNGKRSSPTPDSILVINPATEAVIGSVDATSCEAVDNIVKESGLNFRTGSWSKASATDRFNVLVKAASLLRSHMGEFIDLEVSQTGRPIREMKAQLARIPEWLEYFASLARTYEGSVTPFKGPVINTITRNSPIGVVAQITPWNHPLLIATKKIGVALAAGNTVVVKPSELAPISVLKMGELFQEAGLPDGTLQIICGYGRDTGKFLCENPSLARIDLTGGLLTYQAIAPVASRNLIPITAELGGKSPVCIFPSMDVGEAVRAALFASFIASGQTCVTGSRLLVHTDIYDEFVVEMVKRTKGPKLGDPADPSTQIGAVISKNSVERCAAFVSRAVNEGGRVLCGGKPADRPKGFYFEPTLIETSAKSELSCNEVFGPVIAVIPCASEEEIVEVANGTNFALGASLWTRDFAQAHRVAEQIDAGILWINGHHLNDPSSPWGGFRESGLGKENGREAFESYTKLKSTIINYGIPPAWFDEQVEGARYG